MIYKEKTPKPATQTPSMDTAESSKTVRSRALRRPKPVQVLVVGPHHTVALRDVARLKIRHHLHLTFCDNAYDCLMLSDHFPFDMVVLTAPPVDAQPYANIIRSGKAMRGRRALYVSLGHPAVAGVADLTLDTLSQLPHLLADWPLTGKRH
jgi:hypothetical protein